MTLRSARTVGRSYRVRDGKADTSGCGVDHAYRVGEAALRCRDTSRSVDHLDCVGEDSLSGKRSTCSVDYADYVGDRDGVEDSRARVEGAGVEGAPVEGGHG